MLNNTVSSKDIGKAFFAVLLAVSSLTACGGSGGSGGSGESKVSLVSASGAGLTVSLAPSRTSGVAPLAVFFDATGTTDGIIQHPFHDLEYRWDFGDRTSGVLNLSPPVGGTSTWKEGSGAGVNSRNSATGPVSAHVYETAGTYTATLTVFDGKKTVTKSTTITVYDPEDATNGFGAANKTACVANGITPSAGAGGCPAVATLFYNSGVFDTALSTAIAAGARRILFRRGDTFSATTASPVSAAGPGIIGAYGTGSVPYISVGVMGAFFTAIKLSTSDWRVMDLAIDGTGTTSQYGISAGGTIYNTTILRATLTNLMLDVTMTGVGQLAVVDSSLALGGTGSSGSNAGVFCKTCTNLMLLGNYMYLNTPNSHNTRIQGTVNFVVSNSSQIGSNLIEPITVRGDTQYGVMSDNKFVDEAVSIQPQSASFNEFQRDIIVERNWFLAGNYSNNALSLQGTRITVRNNIFDLSGGLADHAINVSWPSTISPEPTGIRIYNNTIYSSDTGTLATVLQTFSPLNSSCTIDLENNLAYMPNQTSPALVSNGGSCVITGASGTYGNSSDARIHGTDPLFVSVPTDFSIGTSSYAHNAGVNIPVFSDFFGIARPQGSAIDMGAVEVP